MTSLCFELVGLLRSFEFPQPKTKSSTKKTEKDEEEREKMYAKLVLWFAANVNRSKLGMSMELLIALRCYFHLLIIFGFGSGFDLL